MKLKKSKQLTENQLVLELDELGFGGVSKRTIAEWRKEALLPDFDVPGRGRGKGQGKTESYWKKSDLVTEQAKWLQRMRALGIPREDFHINLWMLDYSINPADVRDSLLEPLEARIEMLKLEAEKLQEKWRLYERTDGIIEDVINDGATTAYASVEKTLVEPLAMPQEVLETIANIFLNPNFKLNLFDLDQVSSQLDGWGDAAHRFGNELFEGVGKAVENDKKQVEAIAFLLQNGDFIQRHFSLHAVEKAVRQCTEQDLAEVQADLRILTKIVMILARAVGVVLPHIKPLTNSSYNSNAFLPVLFQFAEYFVLADISLRRNGYSQVMDRMRKQVLAKIEEEFSEIVRKELEQAAPVIGDALSQALEIVERKFVELAAQSPKFQLTNNNKANL